MKLFSLPVWQRLRFLVKTLKGDILVLYYVLRHPQAPVAAKVVVALAAGYMISPIDLVSDFIPLLGFFDDLVVLPLATTLVAQLVSPRILAACHEQAKRRLRQIRPFLWSAAVAVALIWLLFLYKIWTWLQ